VVFKIDISLIGLDHEECSGVKHPLFECCRI